MIAIVSTAGRLLAAHWPAILAWFFAGVLANHLLLQLAGTVGAYSALGGALLLPLGILARVVSYVAMFLVVRDGMRQLGLVAPYPPRGRERRQTFVRSLLASILPFIAFYGASGLLRDDVNAYFQRVLQVRTQLLLQHGPDAEVGDAANGWLELGPGTLALIVVAFGIRWLLDRHRDRLPRWSVLLSVYLETLWVFLAATAVGDLVARVSAWVQTRQAMVWLDDVRSWLADLFTPVIWAWDGVLWLAGQVGEVMLLPLAWLTIAGVVYGQAVAHAPVRVAHRSVAAAQARWAGVPGWLRTRLVDLWNDLTGRFQPIWRAIVLMWRAGPVLIGTYVLAFAVLRALEPVVGFGITRLIGPHDLQGFWMVNDQIILLAIPLVIEPLRIALVAGGYDAVIGRLRGHDADALPAEEPSAPLRARARTRRTSAGQDRTRTRA
ncbi:hypothetical protein [Microbacterium sp. No. 7]|uniref:hypothetical protein n=1 Tax=Microbacterium sp. No. 7 TaxID=1714373 RepID=UPI000AAD63BA|nr:hypothetical protein [Microbacterium sp. No. 7]